MPDDSGVYVIVPAFNEGRKIHQVLAELIAAYPKVVVIDDGSRDDTAAQARRAGAIVLRHPLNRGQGAALQTGLAYALAAGASHLVTFDSDGQHRVEDVAALLAPLYRGEAEIALGSRFIGKTEGMPASRRLLLSLAALFTRAVSGVAVTDAHNGLRAFTRRAAAGFDLQMDRMAHASEIIDQVRDSRLPFVEVPVTIRYTDYSLAKGQKASAAVRVLADYLLGRIFG